MKKILFLFLFLILPSLAFSNCCEDPSVVGCYLLDEASGTLIDSAASGHDSTSESGITYSITGAFNDAIGFSNPDSVSLAM